MRAPRRWNKDYVSAVTLIVIGLGIVAEGLRYRFGSLTQMGAGFIPVVLGAILALVGVAIGMTAERDDFGDAQSAPTEWRGWLCILGAIVSFVVLGVYGGLVPATFAMVFIGALGDKSNGVRVALLLALGITAAGVLIFSVGLHMQFPLFTWG